jgi:hypothetical protein
MKQKLRAMMNRTLTVKDVLILMMLPLMTITITGAAVMIKAINVRYDNAESNLKSTNVQKAITEIQMSNPGITFQSEFDDFPASIELSTNESLFFDGGHTDIRFANMDEGAVKVKGNFQVLNPETNEEVFSVDAESGELFGFIAEDVTPVSIQNGWSNYGQGFPPAGYWKDSSGMVHIRGMIKGGDATGGTVIFDLPEEYRLLSAGQHFLVVSNHSVGEIFINNAGQVKVVFVDNEWVDLSGIYFRTDQ